VRMPPRRKNGGANANNNGAAGAHDTASMPRQAQTIAAGGGSKSSKGKGKKREKCTKCAVESEEGMLTLSGNFECIRCCQLRFMHPVSASPVVCMGKRKAADANLDDSVSQALQTALECPICCETMTPPILQCLSGHSVCTACGGKLTKCPTCRVRLSPKTRIRNLSLENLASESKHLLACRFEPRGCKEKLLYSDLKAHQAACGCRPLCCPHSSVPSRRSSATYANCKWSGSEDEIEAHLVKEHQAKFSRFLRCHPTQGADGSQDKEKEKDGIVHCIEAVITADLCTQSHRRYLQVREARSKQLITFCLEYVWRGSSNLRDLPSTPTSRRAPIVTFMALRLMGHSDNDWFYTLRVAKTPAKPNVPAAQPTAAVEARVQKRGKDEHEAKKKDKVEHVCAAHRLGAHAHGGVGCSWSGRVHSARVSTGNLLALGEGMMVSQPQALRLLGLDSIAHLKAATAVNSEGGSDAQVAMSLTVWRDSAGAASGHYELSRPSLEQLEQQQEIACVTNRASGGGSRGVGGGVEEFDLSHWLTDSDYGSSEMDSDDENSDADIDSSSESESDSDSDGDGDGDGGSGSSSSDESLF